jgi:hypothetical protein
MLQIRIDSKQGASFNQLKLLIRIVILIRAIFTQKTVLLLPRKPELI